MLVPFFTLSFRFPHEPVHRYWGNAVLAVFVQLFFHLFKGFDPGSGSDGQHAGIFSVQALDLRPRVLEGRFAVTRSQRSGSSRRRMLIPSRRAACEAADQMGLHWVHLVDGEAS